MNKPRGRGRRRPDLSYRLSLMLVAVPLTFLAASVGGALGVMVAVAGWGRAALGVGAGSGAGAGVFLFAAWVVAFAVRDKGADRSDRRITTSTS